MQSRGTSNTAAVTDPARDRISQLYFGHTGDEQTQVIARARIDWLAERVAGPRVLDIGCSEGALPVLLGRSGFDVTGIDVNADAIEFALGLLEKEPGDVRARIQLIVGDAFGSDLPEASFDSVVLGEILEHLEEPAALIAVACRYLKPGGRLLVTTPLGYFPDPDHRQTFSLSSVVDLLRADFDPDELGVVDGYIRFVGRRSEPTPEAWERLASPAALLAVVEAAVVEVQKGLMARLDSQVAKRHRALDEVARWKATATDLEAKRRRAFSDLKNAEVNANRRKEVVAELGQKRAMLLGDVARWKAAAEELSEKRQQALQEIRQLRQQLKDKEGKRG